MGLMSFIRKQFVDVIQMTEIEEDILLKKYPMQDQEIQYGGQLIVRDSQLAIFVNEGKIADVFSAGTYTLTTKNMPLLTNLKNWDKLFESPFKSDVYFVNAKLIINSGWGTSQPITIRDKDFGMVRVRAFGKYNYKITDPKNFFINVSGATDSYSREILENQLRNLTVSAFSNYLAQSGVPFIDMASNQIELANKIKETLVQKFASFGLSISDFSIENLNLPEELQKTLDAKISMGIVGNLNDYTKFQMANSIPISAANEGGVAGVGASMGLGLAMAQNLAQTMNLNQNQKSNIDNNQEDLESKLLKAKNMFNKELISQEEYNKIKSDLLSKF